MIVIESIYCALYCVAVFVIILLCESNRLQLMMLWTAPGVLYVKIAGLYACIDMLLHQWLTYLPSPKLATDSASGVDRLAVTVDVDIAQATLPITSATSRGSVSCRSMPVCYVESGAKTSAIGHFVSERCLIFHQVVQRHVYSVVGLLLMTSLQIYC